MSVQSPQSPCGVENQRQRLPAEFGRDTSDSAQNVTLPTVQDMTSDPVTQRQPSGALSSPSIAPLGTSQSGPIKPGQIEDTADSASRNSSNSIPEDAVLTVTQNTGLSKSIEDKPANSDRNDPQPSSQPGQETEPAVGEGQRERDDKENRDRYRDRYQDQDQDREQGSRYERFHEDSYWREYRVYDDAKYQRSRQHPGYLNEAYNRVPRSRHSYLPNERRGYPDYHPCSRQGGDPVDEKTPRLRSRHSYSDSEVRPSSQHGNESEMLRSRTERDQYGYDQRDEYRWERDRYREHFGHDDYSRQRGSYYDRNPHYDRFDYSKDRYPQGYYEGMQYHGQGYDKYDYDRNYSRPGYADYNDRWNQHLQSGRKTPSVEDSGADKFAHDFRQGQNVARPHIQVPPSSPKAVPSEAQPAPTQSGSIQPGQIEDTAGSKELLELKNFLGPLIKGEDFSKVDRCSAELIRTLLHLVIQQEEIAVSSDAADLLLEDHEPSSAAGMTIPPPTVDAIDSVTSGQTEVNGSQTVMASNEPIDRYRNLLMRGQKKSALEYAMRHGLWGRAVLLASKMDPETYASVMTRFETVVMKMEKSMKKSI